MCEIRERNERGECWLIIDGMVLDVTRWLPEHPGGNSIIPEQVGGGGERVVVVSCTSCFTKGFGPK